MTKPRQRENTDIAGRLPAAIVAAEARHAQVRQARAALNLLRLGESEEVADALGVGDFYRAAARERVADR